MDTAIQRAEARRAHVSSNADELRLYEMRQMAMSDWTSSINFARREGMEKGMEKGKLEVAQSLKASGLPITQIVRFTGLSEDQIRKL